MSTGVQLFEHLSPGQLETVEELRVEVVVPPSKLDAVIAALRVRQHFNLHAHAKHMLTASQLGRWRYCPAA